MTSVFAAPRSRVLLVGHGPSLTADNIKAALATSVGEAQFERVVCVRDIPPLFRDLMPADLVLRTTVVNCDVNSTEDSPPADIPGVFLYFAVDMKNAASMRGWRRFCHQPTPAGAFFTGTQALRYCVESFNCSELVTLGIDFDDEYVRAAWTSSTNMPAPSPGLGKRAESAAQLTLALRELFNELKNLLTQHRTIIVSSSAHLEEHFRASIPLRRLT